MKSIADVGPREEPLVASALILLCNHPFLKSSYSSICRWKQHISAKRVDPTVDVTSHITGQSILHVGLDILMTITMKIKVSWVVPPSSSKRARRFGEIYGLRLQRRRII